MKKEAIILVGGRGTRLQGVVSDRPKPMALVNGRPFLTYILDRLAGLRFDRVVLATGYMHECIESYFGNSYEGIEIVYSQEIEPLGTGGAVLQAMRLCESEAVFAFNGDTAFDVDFDLMSQALQTQNAVMCMALRQVEDVSRYGSVVVAGDGQVLSFEEKGARQGSGVINGGVYLIRKTWLQSLGLPDKFSFEKDVMEARVPKDRMVSVSFDCFFIDIGVPEDYETAQMLVPLSRAKYLFLDRDGVINRHIPGYVMQWSQFEFLPCVCESIARLTKRFDRIFVVTNQQGVGKGLFSMADLQRVHTRMLQAIEQAGGRIDHIYVCPDLKSDNSPNRKPAPGMALMAQHDYPEVRMANAVMVGDSVSDLQFARATGMLPVWTSDEVAPEEVAEVRRFMEQDEHKTLVCRNLSDFATIAGV
ncbi:MAG: HAD-IIIA family hydrolase [Paludibacteraceae bacterium]|nr:HAD-IIIA family hydrolase [Paludibacteraceae bacterium]